MTVLPNSATVEEVITGPSGPRAGRRVKLPFAASKKSGYGRENVLESLNSDLQVKNVCVKFS